LYYPNNGRVRVKKLRAMEQSIIARENAYRHYLEVQPTEGDIDFFD
jgi:chemotaxis protein CheD